jgi:hypothetical protein
MENKNAMSNRHPITPPPELVREWQREANHNEAMFPQVAAQAAQWGADQELEACCEWFVQDWTDIETADKLRAARRPNPPSLKEQALAALREAESSGCLYVNGRSDTIRRALEQLND